jgi:hypothetical protein
MSSYGRGRLLLGSSSSDSENERNSETRQNSHFTPDDRQPVPSVSGESGQSVITERRP